MPDDLRQRVEQAVRQAVERLVPINVSARHMHVTAEHLEVLFGPGAQLTKLRDLYQPGEFASNETVSVVGPNRRVFERVRILGPSGPSHRWSSPTTTGAISGWSSRPGYQEISREPRRLYWSVPAARFSFPRGSSGLSGTCI